MTISSRFPALALVCLLTTCTSCAILAPDRRGTHPGLPEGHPEAGEAQVRHHDPRVDAYEAFFRGMLLEQDGRFDEAIQALEAAALSDTRSPAPLIEIMRIQMETGNIEEAEKTGKRALAIDKDLGEVHIALGQMYLDSDRVDEALEHLLRGTELEPENTGALFPLAESLEKSGDREGAMAVLKKLAGTHHEALASFHIARLLVLSGDIPGAVDPLLKAVRLNPSFIRAVGELGTQMEKGGSAGSAVALYEAFLEKDPENLAVRGFLAKAYFVGGQNSSAREQLERILKEDPDNTNSLLLLGLIELREENFGRSLEIFTRLRSVSGDSFETLMQIGTAQREMEMYPEAIATFEETARKNPDRFEPHLNLAIIHDATDDMEKAEESSRTALSLAPERSNIRTYLAQLLTRQERFDEALALIGEGLKLDPEDENLLYQMGITYDQSGRFDLAEKTLTRLLEVKPDHPDALNYLGYSWAEKGMNLPEAMEMIRRALRIRPDAAYIIDSLGWVHYRMGNYEEALRLLLIAVEKMKKDPTVLDHLGDTYEKLGQEELAILYWSKALSEDPDNPDIIRKLREKGVDVQVP